MQGTLFTIRLLFFQESIPLNDKRYERKAQADIHDRLKLTTDRPFTCAYMVENDAQEENITDREEFLIHQLLTALIFLFRSRVLLLISIFLFCHVDSSEFLFLNASA